MDNKELRLERTLEQWAECDPEIMAKQSESAIYYAFCDAKADILRLAALSSLQDVARVAFTDEQRRDIQECIDYLTPAAKEFANLDMGESKHSRCIRTLRALLASAAPAEGQVPAKPRVHINDWRVETQPFPHLRGFANKHPELGDTFVRTSSLVSIETRNTVYVLGEPNSEQQAARVTLSEKALQKIGATLENFNISKEWLSEKLAAGPDDQCAAGDPALRKKPCATPPGCNAGNCLGCGESQPASEQQAARGLSDEQIEKAAIEFCKKPGMHGYVEPGDLIDFARVILAAKGDGHAD